MATHIFDTHESVKELMGAGLPEKHAEAIVHQHAKIINENLATKHDHELLKKEMLLMKKELLIKLGTLIVSGLVAAIGIILAVMSTMLSNIVV